MFVYSLKKKLYLYDCLAFRRYKSRTCVCVSECIVSLVLLLVAGWLPLCLSHKSECGGRFCRLGFFVYCIGESVRVFGGVCLEGLKISGAVKCGFVLVWVLSGFEEGKTCFYGGGKQGLEKTLSKVWICFLSKVSLNKLGFSFIG